MTNPTFFVEVYCRVLVFFQKTKFCKQLQFWAETIDHCRKIFQLDASDWQQICKIIAPADFIAKDTTDFAIKTYDFRQIVRLVFDTLLQCIKRKQTAVSHQLSAIVFSLGSKLY
ncbi:MAG: hypothetical protein SWX82_16945 [Cyanobacteriota bacterium]|nr:hypothetical protein [Cyanobacteriota bacterium]